MKNEPMLSWGLLCKKNLFLEHNRKRTSRLDGCQTSEFRTDCARRTTIVKHSVRSAVLPRQYALHVLYTAILGQRVPDMLTKQFHCDLQLLPRPGCGCSLGTRNARGCLWSARNACGCLFASRNARGCLFTSRNACGCLFCFWV